MPVNRVKVVILLMLLLFVGTAPQAFADDERFDEVELLRLRVENLMSDGEARIFGADLATRRTLQEFYEHRGFRRAWTTPKSSDDLLRAIVSERA